MMILAVSRRLPQLLELQRERTWQPLEGSELRDVTVGIVGLGSIGRAVARLADRVRLPGHRHPAPRRAGGRRFRCRREGDRGRCRADAPAAGPAPRRARAMARRPSGSSADRAGGAARAAGRVRLRRPAAPLTPETEDLIDEAALEAMKPGAWLINVARGRLVDERALLRALRDGQIGGADPRHVP